MLADTVAITDKGANEMTKFGNAISDMSYTINKDNEEQKSNDDEDRRLAKRKHIMCNAGELTDTNTWQAQKEDCDDMHVDKQHYRGKESFDANESFDVDDIVKSLDSKEDGESFNEDELMY